MPAFFYRFNHVQASREGPFEKERFHISHPNLQFLVTICTLRVKDGIPHSLFILNFCQKPFLPSPPPFFSPFPLVAPVSANDVFYTFRRQRTLYINTFGQVNLPPKKYVLKSIFSFSFSGEFKAKFSFKKKGIDIDMFGMNCLQKFQNFKMHNSCEYFQMS